MSLVVNHNLMAMNAARNLTTVYGRLAKSTERLSSGLRINSAADDAAGLAIREIMRADIAVLNQGIRNASDAISMIQTAEGGMQVIDEKLIRMKELAEQAATGTYTTAQREIMNSEYQAMAAEIDRIANATDFNGVKLLDGSLQNLHQGSGLKIHFGTGNDSSEDYYYINTADMRATEATGLRVGNTDKRDTLRTTGINASSPTTRLNANGEAGTSMDGMFGIRFSTDFEPETPGAASWDVYGYVDIDTSKDTLAEIVYQINQGRQASGTMVMAGTTDSTVMAAQSITIGGNIYTFASAAGTGSFDAATHSGVINLTNAGLSAASVAWEVAAYFNAFKEDTGVHAVVGGATINFFATEWGATGNDIVTASATTLFGVAQATLQHGGEKYMTASYFYDEQNGEYELQIQMDRGGNKYQVQVFNLNVTGNTSDPQIVGGQIVGTSMGGMWGALPTGDAMTSLTASYGATDETSEWVQAQNGSGTTEWDGKDILTQSAAQLALAALSDAINKKDTARANLGAIQNRLENTITNLQIQAENLQASESRISDVDVALEMTEFTRNNILAQAAVSMLAQANSLPQLALSLLGG